MLQTFNIFQQLPPESKVWYYLSDRKLAKDENDWVMKKLIEFSNNWNSHGQKLDSDATILLNQIVILASDETKISASGCSIDTSVHLIKEIGKEINVDFFNRLNVLIVKENDYILDTYSTIRKTKGIKYFNPFVSNLHELRNNWLIES